MTQVPLTKAGVNSKQAELYALNQQELNHQSDLIRNDFKNWMLANFLLTPDEQTSLRTMNADVSFFLAVEVSGAIQLRWPVYFEKDAKPEDHGSKRVDVRSVNEGTLDPNGPLVPQGFLDVKVYYLLT